MLLAVLGGVGLLGEGGLADRLHLVGCHVTGDSDAEGYDLFK